MTPVHPETLAALTAGIQSEVASYVFYRTAAQKKVADKHKELLQRLAFEEKGHFHILERQYDSLVRSEKWISTADVMKQEGLPDIPEDMAEQHKGLIDEVSHADTIEQILDIAYRLEEEAHLLFEGAKKKMTSDEGRKMFDQLSRFEEGHMRIIEEMRREYLG